VKSRAINPQIIVSRKIFMTLIMISPQKALINSH
jgi:hypothetical protein